MAGKAKARRSAHKKKLGVYARQFARTAANKMRRLNRHIKNHPNDEFAVNAKKKRKGVTA